MQTSDTEKFKKCFKALGHENNRAYDILFGEMTRLELDERVLDRKKVTIKVLNDSQKMIAETILLLIKSQRQKFNNFSFNPKEIEIKIDGQVEEKDQDRIIDLGNFDYESEKAKFIRRCNATIIANSDIRSAIIREFNSDEKYSQEVRSIEELENLRKRYYSVEAWLDKYENGTFSFFRKKKIAMAYDAEEELLEKMNRVRGTVRYQNYARKKAQERVTKINKKEDTLEGIKYIFTGRREALVQRRGKDGKLTKTFEADGITLQEERYARKNNRTEERDDK